MVRFAFLKGKIFPIDYNEAITEANERINIIYREKLFTRKTALKNNKGNPGAHTYIRASIDIAIPRLKR